MGSFERLAAVASSPVSASSSRRKLLTRLATLSLTVGGLIGLSTQSAAAQGGAPDRPDWQNAWPDGRGWPGQRALAVPGIGDFDPSRASNLQTLVSVNSVNGGSDFGANNGGSDGLSLGMLAFDGNSRRVWLALRGAQANSSYDVQFVRLQDHGREDLGQVTTDGGGNFVGSAPNTLGGGDRVGAFVIIRNGQDEYVSALA